MHAHARMNGGNGIATTERLTLSVPSEEGASRSPFKLRIKLFSPPVVKNKEMSGGWQKITCIAGKKKIEAVHSNLIKMFLLPGADISNKLVTFISSYYPAFYML